MAMEKKNTILRILLMVDAILAQTSCMEESGGGICNSRCYISSVVLIKVEIKQRLTGPMVRDEE